MNIEENIKKIIKTKSLELLEEKVNELYESEEYNYYQKLQIFDNILSEQKEKYRRFLNIKNYCELNDKVKKLNKINKKIDYQQNIIDILYKRRNNIIKEMNKNHIPVLELSREQIKDIDRFIGVDTYSLIDKMYNTRGTSNRLLILEELKNIYTTKVNYYKSLDKEEKEDIVNEIKLLRRMRNFINKYIKSEHKRQNKVKKDIKEEELQISKYIEEIIEKILNKEDISNIKIDKLLEVYKVLIIKYTSINPKVVLEMTKYITNVILEKEIVENKVIEELNSINDTIKYRLINLDKEKDASERKILKDLRIALQFILSNYKEDTSKTKHNYYYDIIFYFLQDESGYPYIKKIVENNTSIINTRKVLDNGESEHIIISILKEYITNHKKMLQNKKNRFINPDYLYQIYLLFTRSYELRTTDDEKKEIENLIVEYKNYIKDNMDSLDRKKEAKKELELLKPENFYLTRNPILKNIDEEQLVWQSRYITDNKTMSINRHNRNLIEDNIISFNDNTAYSIDKTDEEKILKIHVTDLDCMVVSNTTVDSKIYNDMIEKVEIDPSIISRLNFSYTSKNPVITYEIKFDNRNNITDFRIYRSNIKGITKCNDIDMFNRKNETLNNIIDLLTRFCNAQNMSFLSNDIRNIESTIEKILNNEFIKYIDKNDIPFVYGGVEYINDYINQMNDLNNIFARLNKEDFDKIYTIINSNVGEYGYHNEPFNVFLNYDLSLVNKINYLALFNQRLIADVIINRESVKSRYQYEEEINNLVEELNISIGYLSEKDIIFKNKKQRNKLKKYNLYD